MIFLRKKKKPIDFGWYWPIFKVTKAILDLVSGIQIHHQASCDHDTGHIYWAMAFILYLMIVPREKRKPIDFGRHWPIYKVTEAISDFVSILQIHHHTPCDCDTVHTFWAMTFILCLIIVPIKGDEEAYRFGVILTYFQGHRGHFRLSSYTENTTSDSLWLRYWPQFLGYSFYTVPDNCLPKDDKAK